MEGSVLKQQTIDKIIDGMNELPEDKVQSLMDFFRYLIATTKKKSEQKIKISSSAWKQATEELLSLSGIGSSGLGDLASKHDDYLYGKIKKTFSGDEHFEHVGFGFVRVP